MELERKLLEHESTAVPAELLVSFPEKSELVFAALDYLYVKERVPVSKIKVDTIRLARGFLEDKKEGKRKGDREGLTQMLTAWMQARGIDKHNDPNESLIPMECEADKKMTDTLFTIGVEMDKKYKARYDEKLRVSEEKADSLEVLLSKTQSQLGTLETENEDLRRKLHEMEPVYKDALAQHGKMRAQNETLQVGLDKALENYEKLAETLRVEFGQQAQAIIEAKDAQVIDLQMRAASLEDEIKETRKSFMSINEEQRHVFIVDKDHAKTKIADLEERLREAIENRMDLHRKNTRLANEKAALELELKTVQEAK